MRSDYGKKRGPYRRRPRAVRCLALAISMRQCGCTYQQIGDMLGFSRQRAQQLVRPPRSLRLAVAQAAGHCCEDCGTPEPCLHGHIHHRDDRAADFNAMTNLAYLCIACHRRRHSAG